MPLKLFPPGTRKGNKEYVIRGMIDGQRIERRAGTEREAARRQLRELAKKLKAGEPTRAARAVTFKEAAERYIAFRRPSREDMRRIARVVALLGARRVAEITQDDLVEAARKAYPGAAAAATLNRTIIRPAATILHYAAKNRLCPWLRIEPFKEPKPTHKAVDQDAVAALIEAAPPGPKHLLLTWLFCQGTRITKTLRVQWTDLDLMRQRFWMFNAKGNRREEFPLHQNVLSLLSSIPEADRTGRLFPWGDRHNVYRWLRPLAEEVEVKFTPHMARHTLGTRLAEGGASLRAIMDALGHSDVKSSMRYQQPNIEVVRAELNKISQSGKVGQKWGRSL